MSKEDPPPKHGVYASGRSRPAPRKRTGHYYKWARKFAGLLKRSKKTGPQVITPMSPSFRSRMRKQGVRGSYKGSASTRIYNKKKAEASIHTNIITDWSKPAGKRVTSKYDPIKSMLHG